MSQLPNDIRKSLAFLLRKGDLNALDNYVDECCGYFYKIAFFEGKLYLKEKIEKDLKENIKKELSHYLGDWIPLSGKKLRMKRVRDKAREGLVEAFIKKLLEDAVNL